MTEHLRLILIVVCVLAALAPLLATGRGRHGFAVVGRWSWSRMRRHRWKSRIAGSWAETMRAAGLSRRYTETDRDGHRVECWDDPRLVRIRTSEHAVTLTVRVRRGQTVAELEAAAPKLAGTYDADVYRVYPTPGKAGSHVNFQLVLRDLLATPVVADGDRLGDDPGRVRLGRRQDGTPWWLQVLGRQTLVVGCSDSGKGSVLWGCCCGLARPVWTDTVRLHGIDLKGGVELAMGERLFVSHAYDGAAAVQLLRDLGQIANERMAVMRGKSRSFTPTPGDPLHVLVIDELARLTAYADADVKKAATPLLSSILATGRAVGVLVVAFVQDPRKEAIPMRGLFTQTVALRLRSREEVVMVLGDGMAELAPAHRILPSCPGTAWLVAEDGSADRVRADYWPDDVIRRISEQFPAGEGRLRQEIEDMEHV